DKILTSWNALMIKGLTDAYRVFGEENFLELAQKHTGFLLEKMLDKQGFLYHTFSYKNQNPKQKGFLEDYACLIEALVALYQATFEKKYLPIAQKLTDYALTHFYDPAEGMFFFTDATAETLITRKKEIFDNVIPASNSIMAQNLYSLGILLDRNDYKEKCLIMLSQMKRILLKQVEYACNWAVLFSQTINPTAEIAIVGSQAHNLRKELDKHFLPNALIVGTLEEENEIPLLEHRTAIEGKTTLYICFDKTCQLPVFSVEDALKILN
ncbi:MAG: beta-L-arabinofuranosidase domain-containing protein, partial [Raineya sp.]